MRGGRTKKVKRTNQRRETKAEIEARKAREIRKARNRRETQATFGTRISYVKKPFAKRSLMAMILMGAAVLLFIIGFSSAVRTQGQAGLNIAAVGFCSIIISLFAIWYGVRALAEKEKNYILAKAAIAISGCLVFIWLIFIIVGLRG